jgi:transcriptional regulator with GAF, ATPase, and Fis domain
LFIIIASLLVCSYAMSVLFYVLSGPEIGVRCAFSTIVNHFFPEFQYPGSPDELREGDRIVQVADRPTVEWSQLLHQLLDLQKQEVETIDERTASAIVTGAVDEGPSAFACNGQKVVRVRFLRGEEQKPALPVLGASTVGLLSSPRAQGPFLAASALIPGRAQKPRTAWLTLGRPLPRTLVPTVLWFFLKIGLFGVGAIVFWKRPDDRSAKQFFLLCICSLGAYIGGYNWSQIVTQPALLVTFMVCGVLLPAASLHFFLVFPRPKPFLEQHPRRTLALIYGPAAAVLLGLLYPYLWVRGLYSVGGGTAAPELVQPWLDLMLQLILVYFGVAALWYLASIVCLVHSHRTAANATERNQVKWILYGYALALVPIGWSLYLAFWERARFAGGAATWPMFAASAIVTGAFTVSITRYRLMQLDQLLSSGFVYFVISALFGVFYYGLMFAGMFLVGSRVGGWPSLGQALGVGTTALVLMVLLDLARRRFKAALDRHFRRQKLQLDRTLERMSRAIEQLVDPPALARRLLHTAAELLGVARGAVYLRDGTPPLYVLAEATGPQPPLAELSSGFPLVEALVARGSLSAAPRGGPLDPAQRQLQFLGGEVAQALLHEGQLLGLLLLGPRPGAAYSREDCNLLAALAHITVLALVSAEGRRTVEGLNHDLQAKLEKIAEQQRRILALQSQLTNRRARPEERGPQADSEGEKAADESRGPTPVAGPRPAVLEKMEGLVGASPQLRELAQLVKKVAASQSAVLLRGESGTGKGVLAQAIHANSPRADRPFVTVHCTALSPGLLESELFGHVKGAFTNAIRDRVGRFEAANGGTLFLDEIGDISWDVQTKLLRVLQEKTFERVGSSESIEVDVRVIAATHQDLEELIRQRRFRDDLFYRLNVFPITVPPLRERAEDIPELAQHFLRLYARHAGKPVEAIDDDALAVLKGYDWPGNVRQLENVINRAVVVVEGPVVTARDLPEDIRAAAEEGRADAILSVYAPRPAEVEADRKVVNATYQGELADRDRREREHLVRALAAAGGNKAEAARALGMARSTLVSRLRRLGLS